jgi:hypothetical protein
MFWLLVVQQAMGMRPIVICGLSASKIFLYIIAYTAWFSKEISWTWNVCLDFLYKFAWNISNSKTNWTRYDQKCILRFLNRALYYTYVISIKHILPSTRLLIWMHERNTINLHVQGFLRMNTRMLETRWRHNYTIIVPTKCSSFY